MYLSDYAYEGVMLMERIDGKSIFEGIVIGQPYLRKKKKVDITEYKIDEDRVDEEINRFKVALKETKQEIKFLIDSLKGRINNEELKILNVHLMILDDPVLLSEINTRITSDLINVEKILESVIDKYVDMFNQLNDPVYRQRGLDIQDVGDKLISNLLSEERELEDIEGKILITKELFPTELLKIHHHNINILGIITEYGGETSHVAILAKALGIPTLMGAKSIMQREWDDKIILDTRKSSSCAIIDATDKVFESYEKEQEELYQKVCELEKLIELPAITIDGGKLDLHINVGGDLDMLDLKRKNPDGIGLFRSEFIYMDSEFFPSETKQMEIYEKVYNDLGGDRPVIIRTLDIGADKHLSYYEMNNEENPFLGLRGLRFTLSHKSIFKEQLRAILRVAYKRNIKIMYPMVTNLWEIDEAGKLLQEVKDELKAAKVDYKDDIEVGIMIEVPSAALLADVFGEKVDFFSIGTNDLTQYILAADRLSDEVAHLYDCYDPAVLRAINMVAEAGIRHGKKVSVCGEMAGDPMAIIAFMSFGIKDLSMLASFLPRAKHLIRNSDMNNIRKLKNEILSCRDSKEVKDLLKNYVI
jgi:phosphotransferase system enzyme I (PtsI)